MSGLDALVATVSMFSRGLAPVETGPIPDEDCAECHAAIVAEWAESRHALAWTNGIFQREFKRDPLDWCVRCHAPLAPGSAASVDAASAQGVTCVVCHVREGRMVAREKRADSPHDTVVLADYGGAAWCGGCHEFNFPKVDADRQVRAYTEHPMQATVTEFRTGARADTVGECYGCHGNTPEGHRLPGGHDLGVLQHAISLDVCRAGRELEFRVENIGAGHKLPTGDVHRTFRLRAWRSTAPASIWEAFIGRAFEPAEGEGKRIRLETSLAPAESRTYALKPRALGGVDAEPINVELRYIYTADEEPTERNHPGEPTHVVVHERRFLPKDLPPC